MRSLTNFFYFCAGAEKSILNRTPTDKQKLAAIGATVFFTGVFAAISGGFALHTVFGSTTISILFGLLWGMMIFNLDRYIVLSTKKIGKPLKEVLMITPRLLLAILIAFVIAKPLELKLFQSEINSEIVLMEQERLLEQEDAMRTRQLPQLASLKFDISELENQIREKRDVRDNLSKEAIKEADGTGGSGIRNIGPIYKRKEQAAKQAQKELNETLSQLGTVLNQKRTELDNLQKQNSQQLTEMNEATLDGFAAQIDALGRLSTKSKTIFYASLFITLLFIAIETAPLFVKLISSRSPYDYKLADHEHQIESHYTSTIKVREAKKLQTIEYEQGVKRKILLETLQAEKELIKHVIASELEVIKKTPTSWKAYKERGRHFS